VIDWMNQCDVMEGGSVQKFVRAGFPSLWTLRRAIVSLSKTVCLFGNLAG